jgi:hypothetical protein
MVAISFMGPGTLRGADSANFNRNVDFNRDIRPILSEACFQCHGPDASHREADLRLDTQEGALADLGGYAPIVPGKPQESELLRRILTRAADEQMPPPEGGKRLAEEQIALLRRWIEQGARWSSHWAFVPPKRPTQPDPGNSSWPRNPIDTFVLARLQAEHLEPADQANRTTLLRRLSLDLIGLPPTLAEIDSFLQDQQPDAVRRQVERLLTSPHFGERWGRVWLDAARYADSDGFEKDKPRDVWFYRDWVIQALNDDMPYDQFLIEQIAGDLLPGATQDQRVATGFLRNSMINEEGGIDPEQFRMEAMFDRMDAVGSGILGLTIRHGQCGAELSELLPHLAGVTDDITIVRSMMTDAFNHAPAQILMNTGSQQFGKPSLGAWSLYGLGSESRDLPGFVVFSSGAKGPSGGNSNWGSGFLPTVYQGVTFRSAGDPVLYLSNPSGVDNRLQRDSLDVLRQLNTMRLEVKGDPEIATRINSFEVAYRMQSSAPELIDLTQEPQHVLDLYGAEPGKPSFANNCLLARRLVERGVRFVQLFHEAWDQHGNLVNGLKKNCQDTDQAAAALVLDLKQRGLLDETLVIWGGEFGRTPMVQGNGNDGRDHHPNAFSMWLAGGGIQPGQTLGASDELGFNVTQDAVHVRDLHATILHLLGFDHTRLSYPFQGLDQRLTGVLPARVVRKLLA